MARDGSQRSIFDNLFSAQSDSILRFCLIRVGDREQALDLVQETFLRLWQTLQTETVIANPKAFLFTVAHRLIIDWYRKKKPISLEAEFDEEEAAPEPADPATDRETLELGIEGRHLLSSIDKLAPSYRHAIYLRFIEGLSPPEIGEILGVSANAASVRINRAIHELRAITGYGIEENDDYHERH